MKSAKITAYKKTQVVLARFIFCLLTFLILLSFRKTIVESPTIPLSAGIDQFHKTGLAYYPMIDHYLERDFFKKNMIKNGDFSQKLAFWATKQADTDQDYKSKKIKNIFSATSQTFVSAPYSLRVDVLKKPCKIYASKGSNFSFVKDPWEYKEGKIWFGVKPEQFVKLSFYYKGASPTVYINYMKQNSDINVLKTRMLTAPASSWTKFVMHSYLPAGTRAISVEVTINHQKNNIFFMDDFNLEFFKDV